MSPLIWQGKYCQRWEKDKNLDLIAQHISDWICLYKMRNEIQYISIIL